MKLAKQFWCKPKQWLQSGRMKLSPKKKTNTIAPPTIITTIPSKPHSVQKLLRHIPPNKRRRMRPAGRPVRPRNAAVRRQLGTNNVGQRRQIMLVHVTRRHTVLPENRIVNDVGHDVDCQAAIDFEPLGALSPVGEGDGWVHSLVVSAAPYFPGIVEESEEALVGVYEVVVDEGEVEERNACLRE